MKTRLPLATFQFHLLPARVQKVHEYAKENELCSSHCYPLSLTSIHHLYHLKEFYFTYPSMIWHTTHFYIHLFSPPHLSPCLIVNALFLLDSMNVLRDIMVHCGDSVQVIMKCLEKED